MSKIKKLLFFDKKLHFSLEIKNNYLPLHRN